ncbi:NAD(P)-binding protein [Aaosphaeria arxii CBS 175.79]|uniref:NAD(P)-binding protein n=1 Tax=Aaosphaeria arxii CBS 175.79 TaxID=1450172 RepID=A0A6A5XFC6_9PLEO|nr:NAD(P)-binding protein [Aaosphaeria arxii CBS 175.79]KAF2011640.1 NAD(P)-binding protein [Aaosphaeria arxii CBS 175.79]
MPSGTVLLTGASGFLGSHIAEQLVVAGYTVRATFRTEEKSKRFRSFFKDAPVETVVVPDITAPNAYKDASQGVDYVIHSASPFTFKIQDIQKDLIDPALQGTRGVLDLAKASPTLKRVVITSSFAAVIDPFQAPRKGYIYSEKDFNPVTHEQGLTNNFLGYQASKTLAERAAWDFIQSLEMKDRQTSLVTICPPMIFGPAHPSSGISRDSPNESSAQILNAIQGPEAPPTRMPAFVDVRDVAAAHVAALDETKVASGRSERFLVCGGNFTWDAVRNIYNGKDPKDANWDDSTNSYSADVSKVETVLGSKWTSLEDCINDSLAALGAQKA